MCKFSLHASVQKQKNGFFLRKLCNLLPFVQRFPNSYKKSKSNDRKYVKKQIQSGKGKIRHIGSMDSGTRYEKPWFEPNVRGMCLLEQSKNVNSLRPILFELSPKKVRWNRVKPIRQRFVLGHIKTQRKFFLVEI